MNTTSLAFALHVVMALNVLWFSAGAMYFGVTATAATKLLVSRADRQSALFATLSAAVRFLGGMNLAFAVLSGVLLFHQALFPEAAQMAVLISVLALAHGTQFAANVPIAVSRNAQGKPLWPVLSGLMLVIFLVDFALMFTNAALAGALFAR